MLNLLCEHPFTSLVIASIAIFGMAIATVVVPIVVREVVAAVVTNVF